jgi:hypothetical protein
MSSGRKETAVEVRELVIDLWKGDENGPKSCREVSDLLKIPKSTVSDIIVKYKKTGKLGNIQGRRRKPTFNERELRSIVRKVEVNPRLSGPDLQNEIKSFTGKSSIGLPSEVFKPKASRTSEPNGSHSLARSTRGKDWSLRKPMS